MAEELWQTLVRFHREVIAPDLRKMVGEELIPVRDEIAAFKRDVNQHFDELYKRLDTIDAELQEKVSQIEAQLNPPTSAPA